MRSSLDSRAHRTAMWVLGLLVLVGLAVACSDDAEPTATGDSVDGDVDEGDVDEGDVVEGDTDDADEGDTDDVDSDDGDDADDGDEAGGDDAEDGETDDSVVDDEAAVDVERVYDFSAISPIVEAFIEENDLNGAGIAIVDPDDGIIHHQHWGDFSEDRVSLIASSSKMVSAGVLLHLEDDGLLDIDAPLADVVEWGSGNPEITPAQLVSNSSGLIGLLQEAGYAPYICQYGSQGTLQECGETIFTTPADDGDIIGPDEDFHYGGGQWQVAGALAEAVSGQTWEELINEIYVEPCGLEAFGYNSPFGQLGATGAAAVAFGDDPSVLESTDNPNIEGGAFTTTGDYAELLLMHLRGGMCGDTQVLSQDALDRMHSDRIAEAYDGDAYSDDSGYGMGWWVDRGSNRITDGGAFGSVPWLDLELGFGAFLVIEADSITGNELADMLYEPVEAAVLAGRATAG